MGTPKPKLTLRPKQHTCMEVTTDPLTVTLTTVTDMVWLALSMAVTTTPESPQTPDMEFHTPTEAHKVLAVNAVRPKLKPRLTPRPKQLTCMEVTTVPLMVTLITVTDMVWLALSMIVTTTQELPHTPDMEFHIPTEA